LGAKNGSAFLTQEQVWWGIRGITFPSSNPNISTSTSSDTSTASGFNLSHANFTLRTFSKLSINFSPFFFMAQARGWVCTHWSTWVNASPW
jgi:hypothetical protein